MKGVKAQIAIIRDATGFSEAKAARLLERVLQAGRIERPRAEQLTLDNQPMSATEVSAAIAAQRQFLQAR